MSFARFCLVLRQLCVLMELLDVAAYVDVMLVGGIAAKLQTNAGGELEVYIQALAVLAAYRRLGIGNSAIFQ